MFKEIRGQIFTWIGIVGGALTIVNHWSNFITLADWMRWIADHWTVALHQFWTVLGQFFQIVIDREVALALSFLSFLAFLSLGTVIKYGRRSKVAVRFIKLSLLLIAVFGIAIFIFLITGSKNGVIFAPVVWGGILISWYISLEGKIATRIYTVVAYVLILLSLATLAGAAASVAPLILPFVLSIPLVVCHTQVLAKRFTFMLIGVAIIFGLSEVSKLVERFRTGTTTVDARHKV
jgi:hypothetical protein